MKDETFFWILVMLFALVLDVIVFNRATEENDARLIIGSGFAFIFTSVCIGLAVIAGD